MRHRLSTLLLSLTLACGGGTSDPSPPPPPPPAPPVGPFLREVAQARGLKIGAAIDRGFRFAGQEGTLFRTIFAREFNMLTAENDMKHQRIQPQRGVYRFEPADSLVAFAEAGGMQVRGHTLVWHQQLAGWLTAGTWTQEEVRDLLHDHVTTVVTHYRGRVVAWDVVNEALADNGALRSSFWYDRLGREYIELAFRWATEADSNTLLFYNDYNIEGLNAKSDSAYALIEDLLARGVPIQGVGLQGHFQVNGVPTSLSANIARFAQLGLTVHITELDVRMPTPASAANLQAQATNYRDVFDACLVTAACNAIVLWGFTDKESWIPSAFPGWGDALIFDAAYQPKPAYAAILNRLR